MSARACIAAIFSCQVTQQAISFDLDNLTMPAATQQELPYEVLWAEEDRVVMLGVVPGPGAKLSQIL